MEKLLAFLSGKKTYLVAITAGVIAGLHAFGIETPPYVIELLSAFGLIAVRSAIGNSQK
jgi:hypothetical protein